LIISKAVFNFNAKRKFMKFVKTLLFFLAVFFYQSIFAQEIHWTMYDMSPLTLNPANTGAYEGTFRVGGIYRDQYNSISNATGYKTPSFYIDAPIIKGFGKNDWVGLGFVVYNDQAGAGKLTTLGTLFSASYHLGLNKKGTTVLTLGAQGGMMQRSVDVKNTGWIFEDELVINGGQESQESANRDILGAEKRYLDFNGGLLLSSKLNKTTDMRIGIAVKHITQPKYNLANSRVERLPIRISAHGTFDIGLTDKWMLSPSFLFNNIEKMSEGVIKALLGYRFKPDLTFRFGPGYRLGDAAAVIVGMDYKQFKVGLSYDLTVSELSSANNNQGGFEIGVSYIARIFKQPVAKPVIFCPRF
jgi:type IX secretion system PorP/SprF family membrane protein